MLSTLLKVLAIMVAIFFVCDTLLYMNVRRTLYFYMIQKDLTEV
jgi:hypothetical protein